MTNNSVIVLDEKFFSAKKETFANFTVEALFRSVVVIIISVDTALLEREELTWDLDSVANLWYLQVINVAVPESLAGVTGHKTITHTN